MALWVDELLSGPIKQLSEHTVVYDGTFIITTIVRFHYIFNTRRLLTLISKVVDPLVNDGMSLCPTITRTSALTRVCRAGSPYAVRCAS
jgi:hypothetical protein